MTSRGPLGDDYALVEDYASNAAIAAIMAMPEFQQWQHHGPPIVLLTCPRGHPLDKITFEPALADGVAELSGARLLALGKPERRPAGAARRRQGPPVVRAGDLPWRAASAAPGPCSEPGCAASTWAQDRRCAAHARRTGTTLDGLRTKWTCPTPAHDWSQSFPKHHLLRIYAVAIRLGLDRIPVTGAAGATRRR